MISKHLFFRAMREDLRHRIWMIAVSSLGSFLILPVLWLMTVSGRAASYVDTTVSAAYYLDSVRVFTGYLLVAGGALTVGMALVAGLGGFRFVFHKNMVDTYHSLPIKRRTLFAVCYLNGFLIYLVPLLFWLGVTLGMAVVYLHGTPGQVLIHGMLGEAFGNLLVLVAAFLLVYHMTLVAVMVSGNILNALTTAGIAGCGVFGIWQLFQVFYQYFMDTFYAAPPRNMGIVYGSPFVNAVYLLYLRAETMDAGLGLGEIRAFLLGDFGVAVLLGGLAWILYSRRSSELAEQGMRNKVFGAILRFLVGIGAGMLGYALFRDTTGRAAWGVFGALLAEIVAFGIMDMIFQMDFKAFFSHRLQMAATAAVSLAVCLCFQTDAFGYDSYLPDKEEIEGLAFYHGALMNRDYQFQYSAREDMLNRAKLRDVDAAYALLERLTSKEKGNEDGPGRVEFAAGGDPMEYDEMNTAEITVKVFLKNGRSYYRQYPIANMDLDVLWPLLSDEGYLDLAYRFTPEMAASFDMASWTQGEAYYAEPVSGDVMQAIAEAYDQDLAEDPAAVILGKGRSLATFEFYRSSEEEMEFPAEAGPATQDTGSLYRRIYLDVYDSMEHTIEALDRLGLDGWTAELPAEKVSNIHLRLFGYQVDMEDVDLSSSQNVIDYARESYGVQGRAVESTEETAPGPAVDTEPQKNVPTGLSEGALYLDVTSRDEIRELMPYLSYVRPYNNYYNFLQKKYMEVEIVLTDGESRTCYIRKGELPEKYIMKMGAALAASP